MSDRHALDAFGRLLDTMARLRGPGGCPWDLEQSHETLRPYVLEEAYEVVDAIDRGDPEALADELGDLLLQVVFHAQLAAEAGRFSMRDVAQAITEKLERRHPHVFGELRVDSADEVSRNWQAIKASERQGTAAAPASLAADLAAIPRAHPALLRAEKISSRAARHGLDWAGHGDVMEKLAEELGELRAALQTSDLEQAGRELGDLLFAAASLARHLGLSSELALAGALDRFAKRAAHVEHAAAARGSSLTDLPAALRDALWAAAKEDEV